MSISAEVRVTSTIGRVSARGGPGVFDIRLLDLERVIIHDVPKKYRSGLSPPPTLSDVESPLTRELSRDLQERIIQEASPAKSYSVGFAAGSSGIVPLRIMRYLRGLPTSRSDFVDLSRDIARHLYDIQTAVNSSGILLVCDCSLGQDLGLGIIKLERADGIRLQPVSSNGRRTFGLEQIRDLIMTRRTRVFKIALFVLVNGKIEGLVRDQQLGRLNPNGVAKFFVQDFLQCAFTQDPRRTTKQFYDIADTFINGASVPPSAKVRYILQLHSELLSQRTSIDPVEFAERCLDTQMRATFLEEMAESGITGPFLKDTECLSPMLSKTKIDFESGIAILGPSEAMQSRVTLSDLDEDKVEARVVDKLKMVR